MSILRRLPIALLAGAVTLLIANGAMAQKSGRPPEGTPMAENLRGLSQGRRVTSGHESYRELGEVRAVRQAHPKGRAADVLAEQGIEAKSVLVTKGDLVFYVPKGPQAPQPLAAGQSDRPVVLNERTGQLGVVLGTIEVVLAVPGSARDLARDFGLVLKRDFPHLKAAFLAVKPGQDPFDLADALRADPRVASANAEILENPAIPQ